MSREDELGRRVRWLDRYRRTIAVALAIAFLPICRMKLNSWLGAQWPDAHSILLAVCASAVAWWVIEVALAWQAAVWETEWDRLRRDGTQRLPPARLLVRK